MYGPWHGNVPGIYDDPNSFREVHGNPNEDPLYEAEHGEEISASGSAGGSLSLGGASGYLSGSANAGPAPAPAPAPAPSGGGQSWLAAILNPIRKNLPTKPAVRPVFRPAVPAMAAPMSINPMAAALWARHHRERNVTASRERLLEPNKGSRTKVERYAFSVSADIITGTAASFSASNQPDVTFRPQRITANVAHEGLIILDGIRVANVNVTVGGVVDAFDFNANGVGQSLDMPTLSPSNKLTVSGGYTGVAVPGITPPAVFKFVFSAKGPASIVA